VVQTWSLYLTWAWIGTGSRQTDGRMDGITIASTRLALRAVVRKKWRGPVFTVQQGKAVPNLAKTAKKRWSQDDTALHGADKCGFDTLNRKTL